MDYGDQWPVWGAEHSIESIIKAGREDIVVKSAQMYKGVAWCVYGALRERRFVDWWS